MKLSEITWTSFVSVYYTYCEAVGKLLPHYLDYLIAAFLMIAAAGA